MPSQEVPSSNAHTSDAGGDPEYLITVRPLHWLIAGGLQHAPLRAGMIGALLGLFGLVVLLVSGSTAVFMGGALFCSATMSAGLLYGHWASRAAMRPLSRVTSIARGQWRWRP